MAQSYPPVVATYSYATAQTDAILFSPDSGKRFVITDLVISTKAANVVTIEEDISPDRMLFKFDLAANAVVNLHLVTPIVGAVNGDDLLITSTATTDLYVTVCGYEED